MYQFKTLCNLFLGNGAKLTLQRKGVLYQRSLLASVQRRQFIQLSSTTYTLQATEQKQNMRNKRKTKLNIYQKAQQVQPESTNISY